MGIHAKKVLALVREDCEQKYKKLLTCVKDWMRYVTKVCKPIAIEG